MNLPHNAPALDASPSAWRICLKRLTHLELDQASRDIARYLLKLTASDATTHSLLAIRVLIREEMAARFAAMAAQLDFLDQELRKAKAQSRMEGSHK